MRRAIPHILVKPYGDRVTVWVSQPLLMEKTGVKEVYLRVRCRPMYSETLAPSLRVMEVAPASGMSWRWCKMDGVFYYDYDYIPDYAPKCYRSLLPSKAELVRMQHDPYDRATRKRLLREQMEGLLSERYEGEMNEACAYHLMEGRCKAEQVRGYAESWAWARLILEVSEERYYIRLGLSSKREWYQAVAEVLKEKRLAGMRVGSEISIRNKLKDFPRQADEQTQWGWFVHENVRNQHRSVLTEDMKLAIRVLRGMPQNYSDDFIVRKLQRMSEVQGWRLPSERTIEQYMNTKEVQTMTEQSRFGKSTRFRVYTNGTIRVTAPLFAGDCWQMDATRVNFIPTPEGEHLLYCVVRDVYSGCVLGHSYGTSENHAMYITALLMAYERAGYLPYELVYDRFPGSTTEVWKRVEEGLDRLGVKRNLTSFATGKAQLERFFGTMQSRFMVESAYYYGEGIRSTRRYAHRSAEVIQQAKKMAKKTGYDYVRMCEEMDGMLEAYNTSVAGASVGIRAGASPAPTVAMSPAELHEESEKANVIRVPAVQVQWVLLAKKTLKVGAMGELRTRILNQEISYRVRSEEVVLHHKEVVVCYDVRRVEEALVFTLEGRFIERVEEEAPIRVHGVGAELGRLSKVRSKMVAFAKRAAEAYGADVEEFREVFGDETALLTTMFSPKAVAEQAETALLEEVMGEAAEEMKRLPVHEGEEELPPSDLIRDAWKI